MSQSESPIRDSEDEDNIILMEEATATADIAKDEHSSGEIEKLFHRKRRRIDFSRLPRS